MFLRTLRAAGLALIGLVAVPGFAAADPTFPTFVLAPLSAAELSELEHGAAPKVTLGLDTALDAAFAQSDDVDIAEAPLNAALPEWDEAPRGRGIAELREEFETGDTPQFRLTGFSTD